MPEALPELVPLALLFLAFAFVWCARKLLAAMFSGIISAINTLSFGLLGGAVTDVLHSMEQAVDNALGSVEHGIDGLMGSCWHRFAQLNQWLWREFTQHSLIGSLLAQAISELTHGFTHLRNGVSHLSGLSAWAHARIRSLEREFHGIEHRVKSLEHDLSKGIGHDLRIGLRATEKELAHVEGVVIPAIQRADADAADAISNLYEWAKGKASLPVVGTFSLAVATALGALGLGGLRCNNNPLKNKDCGWGGWGDFAGLLAAAAAFGAALDFRDIVKAGIELEALGADAIGALATLGDDAVADAAHAIAAAMRLVNA